LVFDAYSQEKGDDKRGEYDNIVSCAESMRILYNISNNKIINQDMEKHSFA